MKILYIVATVAMALTATPLLAHSGGTDAKGYHAGSRPYHCHDRKSGSTDRSNSVEADRDCADFATWRQAQDFYEAHRPGDPHRLDGDDDGIGL